METLVKKWGNSLGVRLPQAIANEAKIVDGTKVNLVFKKNRIEIVPVKPSEYTLEDMLMNISGENLRQEISTGESTGNEIW